MTPNENTRIKELISEVTLHGVFLLKLPCWPRLRYEEGVSYNTLSFSDFSPVEPLTVLKVCKKYLVSYGIYIKQSLCRPGEIQRLPEG